MIRTVMLRAALPLVVVTAGAVPAALSWRSPQRPEAPTLPPVTALAPTTVEARGIVNCTPVLSITSTPQVSTNPESKATSFEALPAAPVVAPALPDSQGQEDRSPFYHLAPEIVALLPHLANERPARLNYYCPADFNKDNVVDETDLVLFEQAWEDPAHPLHGWTDFDDSGVTDAFDFNEFLDAFARGDCDPQSRADYRQQVCLRPQHPVQSGVPLQGELLSPFEPMGWWAADSNPR